MELLGKIRGAPYFKDIDQRPVEGFRGDKPKHRMLQIRRLSRAQGPNTTVEVTKNPAGIDETQYLLRLNFTFSEPPTETHVSDFVDELAHLIKYSDSPVRNVTWGMLAKKKKRVKWPRFKAAVHEVLRNRRPSSLSQTGSSAMLQAIASTLRPTSPAGWNDDALTVVTDSPVSTKTKSQSPTHSVASRNIHCAARSLKVQARSSFPAHGRLQGLRRSPRKLMGNH